jgi:glycine cleavage system aminomethyltransferase T
MSFEFLAPDAARAVDGAPPPLRSPIEWVHRELGAQFDDRAGWRVVAGYGAVEEEVAACREAVGVADLSHLGKLELQAEPGLVSEMVATLAGGAPLELGRATLHDQVWWCPLTDSRTLTVTPPELTAEVRDDLERAAAGSFASVRELTTALGTNQLAGPLAREAFARATALDLRPGRFGERAFAPVSVARTAGMVLRDGEDSFLHLFGAGFAHYIWTVFVDAAESMRGRAVGADALRAALTGEVRAGA